MLEDLTTDERIILKSILNDRMGGYGLVLFGSG
jgi:hypothetical protein